MKTDSNRLKLPEMDLTDCRSRLIWANRREVEPKYLHHYSSFEGITACWLVLRGTVRFEGPDEKVQAGAGEWLFPGERKGTQHFSPRANILSIRFQLLLPGGESFYPRKQSRVVVSEAFPELEAAGQDLTNCFAEMWGEGHFVVGRNRIPLNQNLRIEAAFYQWLAVYMETMLAVGEPMKLPHSVDDRVRKALQVLDHFPMRETFSEVELARDCGLSLNQLNRLFKQETGLTPFQYYDRQRLASACHALSVSQYQVKEIAFELGFSSSPHFTNWFKQRQGVSPRGYRIQAENRVGY